MRFVITTILGTILCLGGYQSASAQGQGDGIAQKVEDLSDRVSDLESAGPAADTLAILGTICNENDVVAWDGSMWNCTPVTAVICVALGSDPDCDVGTAINTAPARPLVVAYINDDGVDGYSATGDTLIAGIFDTTRDGVISPGDEVRTNQYPLDFDANVRDTFTLQTHVIQGVQCCGIPASAVQIFAIPSIFWFQSDSGVEQFMETRIDSSGLRSECVNISDGLGPVSTDTILVAPGSSACVPPTTTIDLSRVDNAGIDDVFIDVDINL